MKKLLFFLGFLSLTAIGSCQDDTFTKPTTFTKGLTTTKIIFSDGTSLTTTTGLGGTTTTLPWTSITGKPTLSTVATSGSYADLLNKPTLFDGSWNSLTGKPSTFTPATHTHTYAEITGKPAEQQLNDALASLTTGSPVPVLTTAQITALVPIRPVMVIEDNGTTQVLKVWMRGAWIILITAN